MPSARSRLLHSVSEAERETLRVWLHEALYTVPDKANALLETVERLSEERDRLQADLDRSPDEASIAPLHAEVVALETLIEQKTRSISAAAERVATGRHQLESAERQRNKSGEQLEKFASENRRNELAVRSRTLLREYKEALLSQRVAELERALISRFNALCRKEHLLTEAKIDSATFSIALRDVDGHSLDISSFSAGEQQLCQLSILQALRDISNRQLPLAVDTPVARLDGVHRDRFLCSYVPAVSDQVLLFATDAELGDEAMELLRPYTARRYDLRYVADEQCSSATCTETWQGTLALPRGNE